MASHESDHVLMKISSKTRFILSTSGRKQSLQRYRILLQSLLDTNLAYIPYTSGEGAKVDPQEFVWAIRGMHCLGGAISKDIKQSVVPYCDELDDSARAAKSVNTIILSEDGRIKGYNTDAVGFRTAIVNGISKLSFPVSRAVCYGYGGVTNVVASQLSSLGMSVRIAGRRPAEAQRKADELAEWTSGDIKAWDPVGEKDFIPELFVNAAPVTDKPLDEAINFLEALNGCTVAFDHEMPGAYLREYCESNNIVHISGTDMYYPQMISQWSLFLSGRVDQTAIDRLPELIAQADQMAKEEH